MSYYSTSLLDAMHALYPFMTQGVCPLPRAYRSIWRVLHVDGFEPREIQFYAPVRYEWFMHVTQDGKPVGERKPL